VNDGRETRTVYRSHALWDLLQCSATCAAKHRSFVARQNGMCDTGLRLHNSTVSRNVQDLHDNGINISCSATTTHTARQHPASLSQAVCTQISANSCTQAATENLHAANWQKKRIHKASVNYNSETWCLRDTWPINVWWRRPDLVCNL